MSDRLTDPVSFGKRMGIKLESITRMPPARLKGLALAKSNGQTAGEYAVPLPRANPYRIGTKKHRAFLEGYQWATEHHSADPA
jgi:hypothetical protein